MQADTRVSTTVQEGAQQHNQPTKRFRAGPIAATVWTNETTNKDGEIGQYYTISLNRSYKDKEGAWQNTNSFRVNDLPRAQLVLNKAFEWLALTAEQ